MSDVMMPRLSDTMEEGVLSLWLKHEGDEVHKGDSLAEIETDKATMELEAYEDGILERVLVTEGTTVPIGQVIAVIGDGSGTGGGSAPTSQPAAGAADAAPGTAAPVEESSDATPASSATATPDSSTAPAAPAPPSPVAPAPSGPVRTSPLARRVAREHGLDIAAIVGTGPGGRVVRADVEAAVAAVPVVPAPTAPTGSAASAPSTAGGLSAPVATPREGDEVIPLSAIRRITAERLTQSAMAPQFYLTSVVEVDRLLQVRAEVNAGLVAKATGDEAPVKVSVTDLLVRVCALTLRAHPAVNSSWGGDAVLRHRDVNVGVAVAMDEGLVVPVIRDADRLGLAEIAAKAGDLAQRARKGRLKPDEFTGGTFTISNLGMFDVDHFTAVVNPPEAAILAVGAGAQMPVVRDGEVVVRTIIKLTLTSDHRVLDGATSAAFLRDLKQNLQNPLSVLL